tara:strand:+ start:2735 stop:2851 length:117 start_codon:yes stop_codon:yes gene_type:complete
MIVVNAENIRLFSILVLGGFWFYLVVETLAERSIDDDD